MKATSRDPKGADPAVSGELEPRAEYRPL